MKIQNISIHRCLIPVAIAFMLGLAIGVCFPGYWLPALVLACGLAAGLVRTLWRQGTGCGLLVFYCAVVGYVSIQPWLGIAMPARHVSHFADQGVWEIRGEVIEAPQWRGRRLQFIMAASALGRDAQQHAVMGKVKVSTRSSPSQLKRGDIIAFNGRLRAIRNLANPGGFDYARHMAVRGIRARVYARKGSLTVVAPVTATSWQGELDALRQLLTDRLDAAVAHRGADALNLLKALILGQRDKISSQLRQEFNAAGVSHVLAISGLHIGMVAAATFGLSCWLLCWIPMIPARGWTRKGAAVISMSAIVFYALLAGMSPSTQRAAIMAAVVLMGCWIGRRHDWLNALALAALAILVVHPPALLSISFQLSFTAVLAIVVGLTAVPFEPLPLESPLWRRWVRRWTAFMWVSAMAILGTLPLALYYFNQTSFVGLATNMLVVPLVGMVVVPAGLLGVMAQAVSPALAKMLWHVAISGIEIIIWIVHKVAQWPWSALRSVTPSTAELLLYYISFGIVLGWRKLPRRRLVVIGICALWALDTAYWYHQRFGRQDLCVTAIDVGQGTANLLQLPDGYTVLVDGGGFSSNTIFDVGERIVAPILWRQKIKQVDLVVLSHPNSDHLNGLLYILQQFNVAEIWSNHQPARSLGYKKWSAAIENKGIKHTAFQNLPVRQTRHGATFTILSPPSDFMRRIVSGPWHDRNDSSLVLQVHFGQVSFLFTGDITAPAETKLLDRHGPNDLHSTILMVPHHGSRFSSTPAFLQVVKPKEAIISCGWQNRFGFPHQQALERLSAVNARVWRTDRSGAVQVVTNGREYQVTPFRPAAKRTSRSLQLEEVQ